jgi:hypothetical protein
MLSLSITSCKRPELFKRTISSLKQSCCEFGLIDEVVWADDHSSESEFSSMETDLARAFGNQDTKFKIFRNTEYESEDFFIAESLILLSEVPNAIQILLKDRPMFDRYWGRKSHIPYHLWEKGQANDGQIVKHAGFTLNPSIVRWKLIKEKYGYFNPTNIEGSFCDKSYEDGYRTITTYKNYINHIGAHSPSFILNNTPR